MKKITAKDVMELFKNNPDAEIAYMDENGMTCLANKVEVKTYESGATEIVFSWE